MVAPAPRSRPSADAASFRFAVAARALAGSARRMGLRAPSFRTPPGLDGATRTVRRRPGGTVVVAVALRGRPWPAVLADLVEGVVVANRLDGPAGDAARAELWRAVSGDVPGLAA